MKTARITSTMNVPKWKLIFLLLGTTLGFLTSCDKEAAAPDFSQKITTVETETAGSDAQEDSYFDDVDDMASAGLENNDASSSGGRMVSDERLACATVSHDGTRAAGTLRLDFGAGCTDPRGNLRRGAIVIVHDGRWNESGSRWSISFVGYSINGIGIEGTRNVSVISATDSVITSNVVLTGGRITWPDGRVATREVNHRREQERHENQLLDRLIIYGTASGTLRNGRGYSIEILERLIYRRACAGEGVVIPVKGVKHITHGDRELTVDYGDGTCDNIVILTNKNGDSMRYEVGKD